MRADQRRLTLRKAECVVVPLSRIDHFKTVELSADFLLHCWCQAGQEDFRASHLHDARLSDEPVKSDRFWAGNLEGRILAGLIGRGEIRVGAINLSELLQGQIDQFRPGVRNTRPRRLGLSWYLLGMGGRSESSSRSGNSDPSLCSADKPFIVFPRLPHQRPETARHAEMS